MSVSYPAGESPKYSALRQAIDAYHAALLPPLLRLRKTVFAAVTLADPRKAADDQFAYLQVTRETVDRAVELFLTDLAGPDRTREGFSEERLGQEDGILQQRDVMTYTIGLQRGADLMGASPPMEPARRSPAVTKMLDNAFDRLSEKGALRLEAVKDDIHGILVGAQDAGLSPLETARQLGQQFDEYQGYEFERLARTEAAFAGEAGVRDQLQELGVEQVDWLISDGACEVCEDLAAGGPYAVDDEDNLPPAHPNCLAGGTIVSGPAVRASTSRWYVGQVVDIETVGGRFLTVTPNHPVLTPEGWVAAGLLHEGDDVICGRGFETVKAKICPDHYQIPACIEEVAAAVGSSSRMASATVPTTAEDFHGDGGGSEVCVIRTNGKLGDTLDAPLFQPFADQFFARRNAETFGLAGLGAAAERIKAVSLPPAGGLGAADDFGTTLRGMPSIDLTLHGTQAVFRDRSTNQRLVDGRPAAPKVPSQRELILAGEIETDHVSLLVHREQFRGHVYNLQTAGGWFLANGIITHNCLCSTSPVIPDNSEPDT